MGFIPQTSKQICRSFGSHFTPSDHPEIVSDPSKADSDGDGIDDPEEISIGSNPMNPASIPQVTTVQLYKGFNLVAIPAEVLGRNDLRDWLDIFGTVDEIEKVMAYDTMPGKFVSLVPGATDNPAFALHGSEAVYVYAKQSKAIAFNSLLRQAIDLKQGLNLVGIADPPADCSAYDVLSKMGAGNGSSIQRHNPQSGRFETAGFGPTGQLAGMDFPIVPGEGYLIYMIQNIDGFEMMGE